jgi:hypothetical protein
MKYLNLPLFSLALALLASTPARSAAIFFTPGGITGPFDNEPGHLTTVPAVVSDYAYFTAQLDTTGLSENLASIKYGLARDVNVLGDPQFTLSPEDMTYFDVSKLIVDFLPNETYDGTTQEPAIITQSIYTTNCGTNNCNGLPANIGTVPLETVHYPVLSGLNNSGKTVRNLYVVSAIGVNGTDLTSQFFPNNAGDTSVPFNNPEKFSTVVTLVPVPEPINVFGGLLTLGLSLTLKRQLKKEKNNSDRSEGE